MNGKRVLTLAVVLLVCLALAGSGAPAQAGNAPGAPAQLTTLTWTVEGTAGGPGYRLLGAERHLGSGTPCCCAFVPCIQR